MERRILHDRDINVEKNIKKEGIRLLLVVKKVGTERPKPETPVDTMGKLPFGCENNRYGRSRKLPLQAIH